MDGKPMDGNTRVICSLMRRRSEYLKIVIIGGGIAGLAAAYDLQSKDDFEVTLIERSPIVGGKIQTITDGGYLIERGPDSIFSVKPWATELMCELGMENELMEPLSSEFSILTKGRLHKVPRALASLIPSASGALEKVAFLSSSAKKRALKESDVGPSGGEDESIASFFRRRFGRTFSELVAEPLLAGTHAGDPEKLSMAALYPTYLGMEREHGSVAKAVAARASSGGTTRKAGFLTLRAGMGTFPCRVGEALTRTNLVTSTEVTSIRIDGEPYRGGRWVVETTSGSFIADHLILATPADAAANLLQDVAPASAEGLRAIRFVSTAIATLAYPRDAFPKALHGNGFLVPRRETSALTGCTWSSNKWAGRAPDELLLLRAFMGRDGGLDVEGFSDRELILQAEKTLADLLGPTQTPVFTRLDRWPRGLPQYELGHLDRLAEIEKGLEKLPITLIGSSYRGNSIPDCVRQGRVAARQLIAEP